MSSDLFGLLRGDADGKKLIADANNNNALFTSASWEMVGADDKLTGFLHRSLDPSGSKYGGNTDALKTDLLNTYTERGSSAIASIWDAIGARSEGLEKKQFENLMGRLYESAPNRLVSGNLNDTYQAVKSGLKGAVIDDLLLNIALSPVALTKAGVQVGGRALTAAGKAMLGESAEGLIKKAALEGTETVSKEALDQATSAFTRDMTMRGIKDGAKSEAIAGGVTGFLGDIGQQDAQVSRGLRDEISLADSALNTVGGAAVGGLFGGVGGVFEGRRVAKELLANDGLEHEVFGRQASKLMDQMESNSTPDGTPPDGFVTFSDAFRDMKANIQDATNDLGEFTNLVAGGAKSRYTAEQLDVLKGSLTTLRGSSDISESLTRAAAAIRNQPTPSADDLIRAQELEQQAAAFESFVRKMADGEFGTGNRFSSSLFGNDGDINPEFIDLLRRFDRNVSEAFPLNGQKPTPSAAAGTPPASPSAPTTPKSPKPASPSGSVSEPPASPTDVAKATPPTPEPGEITAKDISDMAAEKFSPEEKQVFDDLAATIGKAGTDLQAVLDAMKDVGLPQVAADVAEKSGVDREAIQEALGKVTGAAQRERAKAAEAAPPVDATPPKAEAPQADAPKVDDAAAEVPEGAATAPVGDDALEQVVINAATMNYQVMTMAVDKQRNAVGKVLDDILGEIEELQKAMPDGVKMEAEEKAAVAKKQLDKLMEADPDLAPLIEALDPKKLTSKKGVENAKALLDTMAKDAITFTYAKVMSDILPDHLNVEHFDTVLRAMLRDVPESEVARISQGYKHMVYDAIVERINAIGIDNVQKDKVLGPAWQRLTQGSGGYQRFGGTTKTSVDVGALVQRNIDYLNTALKRSASSEEASAALHNAGKIVRDFMKQLQAAGVPMDSDIMRRALEMKALHAVEDELNGVFRTANAEAFDKLAKMRDLRAKDNEGRMYSRSASQERNPFFRSMVQNPVFQRIQKDDGTFEDLIVSGRSQPRNEKGVRTLGRPQGILSDGISDYLGTLWAHPRKLFGAATAARRAIYGAAVESASWQKGSLFIDGIKFSGAMKELKGLYAEQVQRRMEQSRFGLIADAVERRSLPAEDPRHFSAEAFDQRLKRIAETSRPVTEDEVYVAQMIYDSHERLRSSQMAARDSIEDALKVAAEAGETPYTKIAEIVEGLSSFMKRNDENLIRATADARKRMNDSVASTRKKAGENAEKGTAAKGYQGGVAKDDISSNTGKASVAANGTFVYGTRDSDPIIKKVRGESFEFVPKNVMTLDPDGTIKLFGQKIGTWQKGAKHPLTVSIDGMGVFDIDDLTSLVKRRKFLDHHKDAFEKNVPKMTKAATDKVEEGAQIGKEVSNTQKVDDAIGKLTGTGLAAHGFTGATKIGEIPLGEGKRILLKNTATSEYMLPGMTTQAGATIEEMAKMKGWNLDDVAIYTMPAGKLKKNGDLAGLTTQQAYNRLGEPYSREGSMRPASPEVIKAAKSKKENAPLLVQAQHRALTQKEASEVVLPDGRTLMNLLDDFDTTALQLDWRKIPDVGTYDVLMDSMAKKAAYLHELAPHGVKRNNASRRTSFGWLEEHMAKYSADDRRAMLDLLRRMDADAGQLPYVESYGSNQMRYGVYMGGTGQDSYSKMSFDGSVRGLPQHIQMAHELGHWAFVNVLSPREKMQFLGSLRKYFPPGGGRIDEDAILSAAPSLKKMREALNTRYKDDASGTNELFAWNFTSYVTDILAGGGKGAAFDAEHTLWERVVHMAKNLLQYFMGQKIDPDMLPLFERILPSQVSESKFSYDVLRSRKSGEVHSISALPEAGKVAGSIAGVMERIDVLRGKLGQHILTPGSVFDGGYEADLRSAMNHMFGLLYGKDVNRTVGMLRSKLDPMKPTKEWAKDENGKVVKNAKGRGVHKREYLKGSIDPDKLFTPYNNGALLSAIKDMVPEGSAADIAYDAVAGTNGFETVVKDVGGVDTATMSKIRMDALIEKFKELTGKNMADVPIEKADFYRDALEQAQVYADMRAAEYARTEYGVDIDADVFTRGRNVVLGSPEQQRAVTDMARQLYDLMSDALDALEYQVKSYGYELNRNSRRVEPVEAAPAGNKATTNVATETVPPVTPKSTQRAKKEASERVDGNPAGVPVGASPKLKAIISAITHRDPLQQGIIGSMTYRLFDNILAGSDNLTNADISRITGIALEDGINPEALASTNTAAFDALRSGMRAASEALTNENKSPIKALEFLSELLLRDYIPLAQESGVEIDFDGAMKFIRDMLNGEQPMSLPSYVNDIVVIMQDANSIIAGNTKTAAATKVVGPAEAIPGTPTVVMMSNGAYIPTTVKSMAELRLANLPEHIANQMFERLGIKIEGDLVTTLKKNVGYMLGNDRRRVFSTSDELRAALDDLLGSEEVQQAEAMIRKAAASNDTAALKSAVAAFENLVGDLDAVSVHPVIFDADKLYDPMMTNAAVNKTINDAVKGGKKLDAVLKEMGKIGIVEGETIRLFSVNGSTKLEDAIAKATKHFSKAEIPNAPVVGEVVLALGIDPTTPVSASALETRALLAGAPAPVASIFGNMFKKKSGKFANDGLDAEERGHVRTFRFLQLSDGATRLRRIGADWLADLTAPKEGTGFFEALYTKMGGALEPLDSRLDKLSGVKWWNRSGREIRKNLDMRGHKIWQTDVEERIVGAMRTGDISGLSIEERRMAADLKLYFKQLLKMQNDAGINVADITDASNEFYLPQRMNIDWISSNRDDAIERMAEWLRIDRKRSGGEIGDVVGDARRIINEAINREELQGIIDSSSSTYAQAFGDKLHARKLRIEGKEWERMAPLFDQNLRSLLHSYTEAAFKRVEWSERFGVKGHAASTYLDIADRGAEAAIDALTTKASGLAYEFAGRGINEETVEAVETLFTPMFKTKEQAASVVAHVAGYLERVGKKAEDQKFLVEQLVQQFIANGGGGEKHFRKRAEAIVAGLADFGDEGKVVATNERMHAMKLVGTLGGRPAYTVTANQGARELAAGIKTFNSVTLLAGAVLSSIPDMTSSMFRSGSAVAWFKGVSGAIRGAMGDEATMAAAARIGVSIESLVNENLSLVNGGVSARLGNAFFQATMLAPWTRAMRQTAAITGWEAIKSNQIIARRERFNGNMDSWKYRKSMRFLRQLGLAELVDKEPYENLAMAVNDQKVAEAVHRFVNESVFQPNRNDVPLWAQDPIASIFWQFKSYPMMMGRMVKRSFKEAIATEDGKYAGDPMGLMYLLSVGAAAGAGVLYAKDVIQGRNEEPGADPHSFRAKQYKASNLLKEVGVDVGGMDNEAIDMLLGMWANGLLQLGALGMLGDMAIQSAKQIDNGAYGRERIMSQIVGPTYGTFSDMIQIVEGAQHAISAEEGESNAKERNAVRKVIKRVPFVGQQNDLVNGWVDAFAGERMEDPPQQY